MVSKSKLGFMKLDTVSGASTAHNHFPDSPDSEPQDDLKVFSFNPEATKLDLKFKFPVFVNKLYVYIWQASTLHSVGEKVYNYVDSFISCALYYVGNCHLTRIGWNSGNEGRGKRKVLVRIISLP